MVRKARWALLVPAMASACALQTEEAPLPAMDMPSGQAPPMVAAPPDADGCPRFTKYWPGGAVDMAIYFLRPDGGFTNDRNRSICAEKEEDAGAPEQP